MKNETEKFNDGGTHYFKILKNLGINLDPYITMPIYDDAPDIETFRSTIGVSHPKQDDYIICEDGNIDFVSDVRDFSEISFTNGLNLERLLEKFIICEVSSEIFHLDLNLSRKSMELCMEIDKLETEIDIMKNENEDNHFTLQDIKNHEINIAKLKNQKTTIELGYAKTVSLPIKIETLLKDSGIEKDIKKYLVTNNISENLKNNIIFLTLVRDKLDLENNIGYLNNQIDEQFFDGASPDEIQYFYQQSKEEQQKSLDSFKNRIIKYKEESNNNANLVKAIEKKIAIIVSGSNITLIKKYEVALDKAKSIEKLSCHINQIQSTLLKLKGGETPTALNVVWADYFID
jgi:hypothetical protein